MTLPNIDNNTKEGEFELASIPVTTGAVIVDEDLSISPPVAASIQKQQENKRFVEVIAPSDLSGGYQLHIDSRDNKSLLVVVVSVNDT